MGKFDAVDIPPVESYLYPKSTQTDELLMPKELQGAATEAEDAVAVKDEAADEKERENEKDQSASRSSSPVPIAKELTEEEKSSIVGSEGFLTFLTRSSQLVERKITSEVDVYKPYTKEEEDKDS